jgi:hypothetical protein
MGLPLRNFNSTSPLEAGWVGLLNSKRVYNSENLKNKKKAGVTKN